MKKMLVLLLVLGQLITLTGFAGSDDSEVAFKKELDKKIELFLQILSYEPENYGLENVDFENLHIGKGIVPYMYNGKIEKNEEVVFYPLLYQNKVVGVFTAMKVEGDGVAITYGEAFAKELNTVIEKDQTSTLVLIYDQGDLKAVTEASVTPLQESMVEKDSVKSLKPADLKNSVLNEVPMSTVESDEAIGYQGERSAKDVRANSLYGALDVPKRKQTTIECCWAACVGALGEYETGKYYTDAFIAMRAGKTVWQTGSMTDMETTLKAIYNLPVKKMGSFNEEYIVDKIQADHPIIAGFKMANGENHAVVFRGYVYSAYEGYCALYMDPFTGTYEVGSNNNGKLYIEYKGQTGEWIESCFAY